MKNQIAFTTDIFETRDRKPNFLKRPQFWRGPGAMAGRDIEGSEFKFGKPFQEVEGWFGPSVRAAKAL